MNNKNNKQTNIEIFIRFLKEHNLYYFNLEYDKNHIIKKLKNTNYVYNLIDALYHELYTSNENVMGKFNIHLEFENFYLKQKYNKTRKEIFDQFLKESNIYKNYYNNKNNLKPHNTDINNNKSLLRLMINDAFTWTEAEEGFEFWAKQHHKLEKYCDKIMFNGNDIVVVSTTKNK